MATNVHLTPELDSFARSCVESGQYNSVSEVVRAALRLLQDIEAQRLHLQRLVAEGYASARNEGTVSAEDALRAMDEAIAEAEAASRAAG
jgi:antitoxin ParD1/3/4